MIVYSPDGTTVYRTYADLPAVHWEQTSTDPPAGVYHDLTPVNAESFGYWTLVEVPQPDADHVRTVENIGPGQGFTEVWTFSQEQADANALAADRANKRTNVQNAVATLRNWSDTAEATTVTSGNAVNVLQTVVDNLAIFYDRFADLIEAEVT